MFDVIGTFIVGVLLIVLGIFHARGNINLMHAHHRKRVTKENVIPFGKTIGVGVITIGSCIIVASGLILGALLTENNLFEIIATIIAIVGVVVGIAFIFYAMIKYNKGIF